MPSIAQPKTEDPDVELMLAFQQGDEGAFRMLYEKHRSRVYGWLHRMVGRTSWAEELAQEVFLRVYRAKHQYRPDARFKTWLYTIASRLAMNLLRDEKPRLAEMNTTDEDGSDRIAQIADEKTPSLFAQVEMSRLNELISRCLSKLGERQRAALTLRYFEDLSHEEIAQVLGIGIGAVKSLIHRGLESLEVSLEAEGGVG